MKFSVERERKRKRRDEMVARKEKRERQKGCMREREREEERARKRTTNWLQSCELKTQRRTSRTGRGSGCRSRKGRFETKGAAGTMACNLEPLE